MNKDTSPLKILGKYYKGVGFPGGTVVKTLHASAGNVGSIPGPGRSPGEGNGNLLWYSCLGNSTNREAWRATVHRVAKKLDTVK